MKPRDIFVDSDERVRTVWRVAFFVCAIIFFATVATTLVSGILSLTPLVDLARQNGLPLAEVDEVIGLLAGTYLTLRVVDGVRSGVWGKIGLGASGLRARPLLIGLAAGTLAILIPCALLLVTKRLEIERQPELQSWWSATRSALFLLTPAALAEELTVRGYLLTTLVEGVGKRSAVIITSVIFALLHLLNPEPTFLSAALVALAGVFLAVIRLTTGSLWAATVAHLAWNLVQAVVLHAPVSGLPLASPGYRLVDHGPIWLTGGTWGPEGGLAAAAGMLVATFLLLRYPRELAEKIGQ